MPGCGLGNFRQNTLWSIGAIILAATISTTKPLAAQEVTCQARPAVSEQRVATLDGARISAWATAPVAGGGTLSDELFSYGVDASELFTETEMPVDLPGPIRTSIYLLERRSAARPESRTWVLLYSTAPTIVRKELEHRGISYPWSGFVLSVDEGDEVPIRLGVLGQPKQQLAYDVQSRSFVPMGVPFGAAGTDRAISSGCIQCIKDLILDVACEAAAEGISCSTIAACPGAILSALIRATFRLITTEVCFPADLALCAVRCAAPQITITPASNAHLNSGQQRVTVNISGTNAGAWMLAVPQGGLPSAVSVKIGTNPRVINWNPADGVYTLFAGNIPLTGFPWAAKSTNVAVGQSGATGPVSWTITDACVDGRGFRLKFFDKTRGGTFPSSGSYSIPNGQSRTFTFNAPRGSRVCLGAVQDPPTSTYWCYGIDGTEDGSYSSLCCQTVPQSGTLAPSLNLICD